MSEDKPPIPATQPAPPPPAVESTPLIHGGAGVVITQPPPSTQPVFKEFPVDVVDEKGNKFTTEVKFVPGLLTWVAVGLTCLIAGSFGLPCIGLVPLCIKSFKDVEHINPQTGEVVGKYDRGADLGLK